MVGRWAYDRPDIPDCIFEKVVYGKAMKECVERLLFH